MTVLCVLLVTVGKPRGPKTEPLGETSECKGIRYRGRVKKKKKNKERTVQLEMAGKLKEFFEN